VVRLLLDAGADVNGGAGDGPGCTPLFLAARGGHEETCALLLQRGARLWRRDAYTPDLPIIRALAWPARERLCRAAIAGHPEAVRVALRQDGNVNQARWLLLDEGRMVESNIVVSPLSAAVAGGSAEVVRLFLDRGARLNDCPPGGMTALHWAVWTNKPELIGLLLRAGADVSAKGELPKPWRESGHTPLGLAAWLGREETAKALLSAKPSQAALDAALRTAADGSPELVRLLLKAGASPAGRSDGNSTALHIAAAAGDWESVDILLEAGADVTARNDKGQTPLHVAAEEDQDYVVRQLLSAGAQADARDASGLTSAEAARGEGSKHALRALEKK
jgi:ankyrin repeat protein